jgi:adenylate cyclase
MAEARAADTNIEAAAGRSSGNGAVVDPIQAALEVDKREGLRVAVKARWVALAIIAPFLVYLNPTWSVLYYEAMLGGFALIGWVQIKAGRLGKSKLELALI